MKLKEDDRTHSPVVYSSDDTAYHMFDYRLRVTFQQTGMLYELIIPKCGVAKTQSDWEDVICEQSHLALHGVVDDTKQRATETQDKPPLPCQSEIERAKTWKRQEVGSTSHGRKRQRPRCPSDEIINLPREPMAAGVFLEDSSDADAEYIPPGLKAANSKLATSHTGTPPQLRTLPCRTATRKAQEMRLARDDLFALAQEVIQNLDDDDDDYF